MSGKNLLEGLQGPVSQSVDAVKALLTWKGRAVDPLPSVLEFTHEGEEGRMVLLLSNQKDNYYVVTPTACSCPARTDRSGEPCKHMRKYFGAKQEQVVIGNVRPTDSFKQFSLLPGEEKAAEAV
jgi:hypothetical protein